MNQYAVEDNSNMPPQLGSDDTADRQQAEPTTIPINSSITPEPAGNNNQIADEAANSRLRQDAEMGIVINRQDFELLWRLRKYLLLLAMLSVSVTYVAGLSPPGGFWTDNRNHHHAGDPLLPVAFFERYEVFFYCNATAFAASLVLIILLLSRGVSSQQVWLRSMQVTMILDLFSLMGAFAAGSCRALRSSSYILALVLAVFLYVGIHILVFMRVVPKRLKEMVQNFLQQIEQMTSQNGHVPEEQSSIQNEDEEIEEARKFILMLATFAATITYQAGMSPPGGFWAENNGYGYRPATFVLRRHNLHRFNIFICCNATSFVASLGTIILLLSTKLSMHGIRTQALSVCVIADLLSLIGAYAAGCCRDVATSLFVIFIIAIVLICVLILVIFFQSKPVTMWIDKEVKPRFDKFLTKLSWPRERHLSNAKQYDSQPTHPRDTEQSSLQQDTEHLNCDTEVQVGLFNAQCHSSDNHLVSTEDMTSASTSGFNSMKGNMTDMLGQSHDQNEHVAIRTVRSASEDALITKEVPMSSMEEKSAGSQQDAIPKETSSSSDGVFFFEGR